MDAMSSQPPPNTQEASQYIVDKHECIQMQSSTDNIYNNIQESQQCVYNAYNTLVFSNDNRVFNKMIKRFELYMKVKDLVGDIVEFGVFKGASIALWLNIITMYEPNSLTKVIGFDYFDPELVTKDLEGLNKTMMTNVLNRVEKHDLSLEKVKENLFSFEKARFDLIQGDAVINSSKFVKMNPGFKIKLLYMDLDLGKPTYEVLVNLWEKIHINGIIVFDEYGYHKWDETIGVDKFLETIPGKYQQFSTGICAPTLYIQKLSM